MNFDMEWACRGSKVQVPRRKRGLTPGKRETEYIPGLRAGTELDAGSRIKIFH